MGTPGSAQPCRASEDEVRSQAPGQGQESRVWRGWQEPEQDSEGHIRGSRGSSQAGGSGGRGGEQGELPTVSKRTASLRFPFCIPYRGPFPLLAYQATFPSTNLPRSSCPCPRSCCSLNPKGGSTRLFTYLKQSLSSVHFPYHNQNAQGQVLVKRGLFNSQCWRPNI